MEKPFAYHCVGNAKPSCCELDKEGCYGLYKTLEDAVAVFRKSELLSGLVEVRAVFDDLTEIAVPDSVYLKKYKGVKSIDLPTLPAILNFPGNPAHTYVGEVETSELLTMEDVKKNEEVWLVSLEAKVAA